MTSTRRRWTTFALGLALAAAGCNHQARDRVQCRVAGNNVACTVISEQGNRPVSVCWDVAFTCADGANVSGHACQDMDPGSTAEKTITANELQGLAQCNGATSFVVRNVQITPR